MSQTEALIVFVLFPFFVMFFFAICVFILIAWLIGAPVYITVNGEKRTYRWFKLLRTERA